MSAVPKFIFHDKKTTMPKNKLMSHARLNNYIPTNNAKFIVK